MSFNEDNFYLPANTKYLTNPLLRKPVVGYTRGAPDPLPGGERAIYGRPGNRNEEGAAEVVQQWKTHTPKPEAIAHRDFVRTNKMATANGCTTAKSNARYRTQHMFRQRKGPTGKSASDKAHKAKLQRETFGMQSRPSTPIKLLVMGEYQRRWVQSQKDALQKKPHAKRAGLRVPLQSIKSAGTGDGMSLDSETPAPFKMKQFANVKSRVPLPEKNWHLKLRQQRDEQEQEEQARAVPADSATVETADVSNEAAAEGLPLQEQ